MYQYDFSVVMAVYNVEDYLREAVESLVHQTIGFSRIQLILVDDGSTDGSGKICDEYQKKYPENVVVIHKENGRQASARNAGLPYVKGKYVNFMDPDDTLDHDTLEKVFVFMEEAGPDVSVCCIPMYFFGDYTGSHMLNYKFENGSRVVNLLDDKYADCFLMSTATSFIRSEVAQKLHFDTELFIAEDAKEIVHLLIENPLLGLVSDAKYNYRKYGKSTLDRSGLKKESYLIHLKLFSEWAINFAENRYGFIPRFVQHTIMYDLQWKVKQVDMPKNVLTEQETKEYKNLLYKLIKRIDDDIILAQKSIGSEIKLHLIYKKYEKEPKLEFIKFVKKNDSQGGLAVGDIVYHYGETEVTSVSLMKTVWEFLTFNKQQNTCVLEGYHILAGLEKYKISPILKVNKKIIKCDVVDRTTKNIRVLGEKVTEVIGFRCEFSISQLPVVIVPGIIINKTLIYKKNYNFGQFFPVSEVYRFGYAITDHKMIYVKDGRLILKKEPNVVGKSAREVRLLAEIWNKNYLGGRKAVGGRLFYHLVHPFKRKKIWIVSDRIMKADDNGEALFRYLQDHMPANTKVYFSISKQSPDYKRMEKIGKCVDAMSFRHKLIHLLCDLNISSQADAVTINPYAGHAEALRDLLLHQKFVFLQHGITKDDISRWINRYNKNICGFVTAAFQEYESIKDEKYAYAQNKIWLTGFPRFDRLYHNEQKVITIMPTWREYLMDSLNGKTGQWGISLDFMDKEYYRFYNTLVNSPELLSFLESYNYTLQFFPHPNLQPYINCFSKNERVRFLSLDTSYNEVYAQSNLVVTDYSSAVFDFAYLRKPVIYCHFDKVQFFGGDHVYTAGYFDYERDGFGEVTYSLQDLIDCIKEYVIHDCELKDMYRKRIERFFAFNDQDNCKRVYEHLLEL